MSTKVLLRTTGAASRRAISAIGCMSVPAFPNVMHYRDTTRVRPSVPVPAHDDRAADDGDVVDVQRVRALPFIRPVAVTVSPLGFALVIDSPSADRSRLFAYRTTTFSAEPVHVANFGMQARSLSTMFVSEEHVVVVTSTTGAMRVARTTATWGTQHRTVDDS